MRSQHLTAEGGLTAANFVLDEYLARIGFTGPVRRDAATLAELMRCQLCSVPFENLDVQAGKIVSLVPEEIVDKIVRRRRGGYCYEVNGLFSLALDAIGFAHRLVAARPMFYPVRRPKTHMALVVSVEGAEWLCDLGFGSYGPREPISLGQLGCEVVQGYDAFKLSMPRAGEYLLQARVDGVWANQYAFDRQAQEWIDFIPANYLNSTHPDAVFVQKPLVVVHHGDGRKILFGESLKIISKGRSEKRSVAREEYDAVLKDHFGLPSVQQVKQGIGHGERAEKGEATA